MKDKMKRNKKVAIVCGILLTAVSFVAVPPVLKKYGSKIMKWTGKSDDIDFDSLGPEIVKKGEAAPEEE